MQVMFALILCYVPYSKKKPQKEIPLYIKDIIVKLEVPLLKSQYVIASITITTEAFVIVYYAKEAVLLVM